MEEDSSATASLHSLPSTSRLDGNGLDIEKHPTQNTEHAGRSELAKAPTAQDWTGPDDPENPENWPIWSKIYHTGSIGLLCFASTFGTSVYTPGVITVMERFNVSVTAAYLPLSLFTIGLAFGPIMGAPISEALGRKAVYVTTYPPALLFTMGAGLAQNFGTLLVCRFLAGTFASPALAVGAGSNSDLWKPLDRAVSGIVFLLAPFAGPALGPTVGGFCAQRWDWRWTQWMTILIGGFAYIFCLFQKETYKKIILQRRAKRLNIPPPPQNLPSSGLQKLKIIFMITIGRPIVMLFTEPVVGLFSIYTAFNFSVLFGFFAAFPVVFVNIYNFDLGELGLSFLGIGLGCLAATFAFIIIDRITYRKKALALKAQGRAAQLPPETRLFAAMLGSVLLPVGLFWFAWTARKSVHWIVPLLATVPFACGNLLVFCSCVLYLIDTYGPMSGASSMAANGILRYGAGAAFPLFSRQMYEKLGVDWATSLFGFITVGLLPIPWLFYRFGPTIRRKSQYSTFGK